MYKKWWDNITKDFKIKLLSIEDIDEVASLIRKKQLLWKTISLSTNDIARYIEYYEFKLKNSNNFMCVGAYYDNKLVMENSAYFSDKINHWHHLSLRFDNPMGEHVNNGVIQRYLFADCFIPILLHAENIKRYTFYTMRSIEHQKIIDRMWNRTKNDSPLSRYDYYLDGKIPANTKNINSLYSIFFPNDIVYEKDLVVYMHCLKHEYRN